VLEVRGISSFYGHTQVLHDVSIDVPSGGFVIVLGPNGHGKSTLLRTICGLHKAQSGSVVFYGEEIEKRSCADIVGMGLVYVAENRHLFPSMSVKENLLLGAYNPSAWKQRKENLEFVFELFPKLSAWRNRAAGTLSGGEARMVAIGRGLMAAAKFVALDEPSVGLAPNVVSEVFQKAKEINDKGISILLVEQNVAEVLEFGSKIYVLEEGHVVLEGTKDDILGNAMVKELYLGL
jgi:branched-chain amino acid transport system ATP-binding protein